MITSPKAKAIIAAIVTIAIGVIGQVLNLNLVSGDAQNTLVIILGVLTALGTTLGVYAQKNAET